MLARFHILLPFNLILPDGETFSIYGIEIEDYKVHIYPPAPSDAQTENQKLDEFYIGGKKAVEVNALRIDFIKEDFRRDEDSECDPPYYILDKVVNDFLVRLRFVTRAAQIRQIIFPNVSWNIQYLNDDESELIQEKGKIRGRGSRAFKFSWITIDNRIWENIHSLPADYSPPVWDTLLLDASDLLPEVGASIVLSAAALEVFISWLLEQLAGRSSIPPELWEWINHRQHWTQNPSVGSKFDLLLKVLLGVSLKDQPELWEAFKNIRTARNSFAHEGIAKIGGRPIDEGGARRLVGRAAEIVRFVRDNLPDEIKWPEFKHDVVVTMKKTLLRVEDEDVET